MSAAKPLSVSQWATGGYGDERSMQLVEIASFSSYIEAVAFALELSAVADGTILVTYSYHGGSGFSLIEFVNGRACKGSDTDPSTFNNIEKFRTLWSAVLDRKKARQQVRKIR